jgi:hypothetical protein
MVGAALAAPTAERALRRDLLSGASATLTLQSWCARDHLATPAVVRALRDPVDRPADAVVRHLLGAAPGERIAYRRVKLVCGDHVLSVADNWYLPARLTPAMNRALETSDTPFGLVVRPMGYRRETLSVASVSHGGEVGPEGGEAIRIEAVLRDRNGAAFSLVREHYARRLIAPSHSIADARVK